MCQEDGTPLEQVAVEPDWEPAHECVRLAALEAGLPPDEAFRLAPDVEPIWSEERGLPYLDGCRIRSRAGPPAALEVGVRYFARAAREAASGLVDQGRLATGDRFLYRLLGFQAEPRPAPAGPCHRARAGVTRISVQAGSLGPLLQRASAETSEGAEADLPAFVPAPVLDEMAWHTGENAGRETGGILAGYLRRDGERARLFLEVTAQIPAPHTESDQSKLTFTADTWTEVRSVLELRRRRELMLGWWHSHPVREWCKQCPEERQRVCALADGFLSDHDRLLHRAVFPRAFTLALVVSDVAFGSPRVAAFGWRSGMLERRGFHRLPAERSAPSAPSTAEATVA
jgi:hypothetical protein